MNNHETVRMRAHRSLKSLSQYRDLIDAKNPIPGYIEDLDLRDGETLIGVYENSPGDYEESIVVTDMGMKVFLGETWEQFDYCDVKDVRHEPFEKQYTDRLILTITERTLEIPVRGWRGQTRDAFSFLHFLRRVTEHYDC